MKQYIQSVATYMISADPVGASLSLGVLSIFWGIWFFFARPITHEFIIFEFLINSFGYSSLGSLVAILSFVQLYLSFQKNNGYLRTTYRIAILSLLIWWVLLAISFVYIDFSSIRIILYWYLVFGYTWLLWRVQSK